MPSIRASQKVDRKRIGQGGHGHHWKVPIHPPDRKPHDDPGGDKGSKFPPPAPPEHSLGGSSSMMMSSLPPLAASYDQFVRQFYTRGLPQQRIFLVPPIT